MTEKPEENNNSEKDLDSLKEELKDLKKKKELEKLKSEVNSLKNGNETVSDPTLDEIKSKKTTAGIVGIFLGAFGGHKFVLGYQREGFIYLGVSVIGGIITCGGALFVTSILGLVESIMLLTKTPEEFKKKYVDTKTPWF